MKIVTLMENTTCREELQCEHGLSLYIESQGHRILFDMGQSGAFAENAENLGVDLTKVEAAVLSHGHYDHGGGIGRFLKTNAQAPIYVNSYAFEGHFNAQNRNIGLNPGLDKSRMIFVDKKRSILPGITLHTLPVMPENTFGLQRMENGQLVPEDFRHEQYLLLEENGIRVLLSGCAHKGIVQIARAFQPDVLIGGFHLSKIQDKAVLDKVAGDLLALSTRYYTGHCTGREQFAYLKKQMGGWLEELHTGSVVHI